MKFLTHLPPREHYTLKSQSEKGWIWIDRLSDRFEILMPSQDWERNWIIVPQFKRGKSDQAIYLQKVRLCCYFINEEAIAAQLIREDFKADLVSSYGECLSFFAAPIKPRIWLGYTFKK